MLPSQTVENYLKTIYLAQVADSDALVPMGQLASALGVVPGTATTMVKTLAESGLVRYEPYMGVRLTKAGEKLASLVLRRHRLIELFLVRVLDMSWAEVHDEAERLEHAVSERLIERIDAMLGRPVGRSPWRSDSNGGGHHRPAEPHRSGERPDERPTHRRARGRSGRWRFCVSSKNGISCRAVTSRSKPVTWLPIHSRSARPAGLRRPWVCGRRRRCSSA